MSLTSQAIAVKGMDEAIFILLKILDVAKGSSSLRRRSSRSLWRLGNKLDDMRLSNSLSTIGNLGVGVGEIARDNNSREEGMVFNAASMWGSDRAMESSLSALQ